MSKKSSVAIPNLVKQTAVVLQFTGREGGGGGRGEGERILLSDGSDCNKP